MCRFWCLAVLVLGLDALLQGVNAIDEGYVFLDRERENFVSYQADFSTKWRPREEGSLFLRFRTSYKDGLLAFAEGPTGRLQLWLEEGRLRVEYSVKDSIALAFTVGRRLHTDAIFNLTFYKQPLLVGVTLNDSVNAVLYEEVLAHDLTWDLDSYVYVGGVLDALTAKVKSPAKLIGCISDVGLSNSSAVEVASASLVAQSGAVAGNCVTYNLCQNSSRCFRRVDCVNLWNDTACDCRTASKSGPTCTEEDFINFEISVGEQDLCTDLTLLTEPAFQALESLHFATDVNNYFTEDPRVFLYLTSSANSDVGVAVVGFYNANDSELFFEARVYLLNGTVASTGSVSYFASISVNRYSDEVVLTNSIGPSVEQRVTGLEGLADIELDRLCIGGVAPGLAHPSEGTISRVFVNGINVLTEGTTFTTVPTDLTSIRFITPESKYTVESCPRATGSLQFSFVTFDQNAVLATFTTDDPAKRNLTIEIVNSEMQISLGDEVAMEDPSFTYNYHYTNAEEVRNVSNGQKHSVNIILAPDPVLGLGITVDDGSLFYTIMYSHATFTVCTNGMTIGEGFVGCVQDMEFQPLVGSVPVFYNFSLTESHGSGLSNRRCMDPCELPDDTKTHCGMGTCVAISETEYMCPDMLTSSSSVMSSSSTSEPAAAPSATRSHPTASITTSSASPASSATITDSSSSSSSSSFTILTTSTSSTVSLASSSVQPSVTDPGMPGVVLEFGEIVGIAIGGIIALCIIILVVVITILACLIIANRQGYYPTKEASMNEPTLLKHNASLRSVSSTRPLHSSAKLEAEYYI